LQPPKATHECNHKSPIPNRVELSKNLQLFELKIILDIFFITLWLCEGYYIFESTYLFWEGVWIKYLYLKWRNGKITWRLPLGESPDSFWERVWIKYLYLKWRNDKIMWRLLLDESIDSFWEGVWIKYLYVKWRNGKITWRLLLDESIDSFWEGVWIKYMYLKWRNGKITWRLLLNESIDSFWEGVWIRYCTLNEEMAMVWSRRKWKKMWSKQQGSCFCRLTEEESDQNYIIWSEYGNEFISLWPLCRMYISRVRTCFRNYTLVIPMNDKCRWVHELVASGWTEAWLLGSYHAPAKPHSVSRIPTCCCCDVMLIRCVSLTSLVETCTLSQLLTYQSWSSLL
jgi:hypothetical protein